MIIWSWDANWISSVDTHFNQLCKIEWLGCQTVSVPDSCFNNFDINLKQIERQKVLYSHLIVFFSWSASVRFWGLNLYIACALVMHYLGFVQIIPVIFNWAVANSSCDVLEQTACFQKLINSIVCGCALIYAALQRIVNCLDFWSILVI